MRALGSQSQLQQNPRTKSMLTSIEKNAYESTESLLHRR